MALRRLQDDTPPWSYFLPMMLAVALGVLIAEAVKVAVSAVFARQAAPLVAAPAVAAPAIAADGAEDPPADASGSASLVEVGEAESGDVVMLPGPITAMRDGAERACINDTIAMRRPNGWEQGLENDAPLRCRANSP